MKKLLCFLSLIPALSAGGIFAENVFNGAENINLYGSPRLTAASNSAAGGPLFSAASYSLISNPALTAALQCPVADFGVAVPVNIETTKTGAALQLGASFPTRRGVFTGVVQGDFLGDILAYSNIVLGHLGFSRDVTENFYLGLSLSGGALFGGTRDITDFYITAGVGAWYRIREFPALKDGPYLKNLRFGLALQNMGKTFTEDYRFGGFPGGFFSPKAGAAVNIYDSEKFKTGFSVDVALPALFTNFAMGMGLQAEIAGFIFISAGWDFNIAEVAESGGVNFPYAGIGLKFSLNTSGTELLSRRGFNQTDINADMLWQALDSETMLFSAGAGAKFGVEDAVPPEIRLDDIKYGTSNREGF